MTTFVCFQITIYAHVVLRLLHTQAQLARVYAQRRLVYISNTLQYLKNEERYGKTIDGVSLSFQEFFQIRET